jgi:hypothetical protein
VGGGDPFRGTRRPSGAPAQQGRGAMAGVGHGRGAAGLLPRVTVGKEGRERIRRMADGWGPLGGETRGK